MSKRCLSSLSLRRRIALVALCLPVATLPMASGRTAQACDMHAIYVGTLQQQSRTGVYLGLSERYTEFSDVRHDGESVPNNSGEWIHSSVTQLVLGYAFTPQLSVMSTVPLISRDFRSVEDGIATTGNVGGLGDVSFLARFAPLNRSFGNFLVRMDLFAGVKTPTGSSGYLNEPAHGGGGEEHHRRAQSSRSPRHGDEDHGDGDTGGDTGGDPGDPGDGDGDGDGEHGHEGLVHGHDLTLGSGSVDGLFGVNLFTNWRRYFFSGWAQYGLRGDGDYTYAFANDVTWELSPGFYMVTRDSWTLASRLILSGDHKERDRQYGAPIEGTDLTSVYIGPGLSGTWKDHLQSELIVEVPIMQENDAPQLVANYRLRFNLMWRF